MGSHYVVYDKNTRIPIRQGAASDLAALEIKPIEDNEAVLKIDKPLQGVLIDSYYITEDLKIIDREYTDEELKVKALAELRKKRAALLAATDHYMLADNTNWLTEEQIAEVKMYRQELRDLPQNFPDGTGVVWPTLNIQK